MYVLSEVDEVSFKMLVVTWMKKGVLAGSIYESFNYVSQTEFQLEGKVGVRK